MLITLKYVWQNWELRKAADLGSIHQQCGQEKGAWGQQNVHACPLRVGGGVSLKYPPGPKFEKNPATYFRKCYVICNGWYDIYFHIEFIIFLSLEDTMDQNGQKRICGVYEEIMFIVNPKY